MLAAFLVSLGLVARAQNATTAPSTKVENIACVKTAVDKRETAVQTAFDTFSASAKSALQARKSELLTAWDIVDRIQRRTAINSAWNKFRTAQKEAKKVFNQSRLSAWNQFTTDRKACKSLPTGEDPGTDLSL